MSRIARSLPLAGLLFAAGAAEPDLFDRWDENRDGALSREELPAGARRNFDRVDRDGNGTISRGEHRAFMRRTGAEGADRPARPLPDSVELIADIPYAGDDNPRRMLDLILPRQRKDKPLPVIAFIHGGGWQNGDRKTALPRLVPFAASGDYAGVSIGYRLSGEAQWPAQIHDCKAAIRAIRALAPRYHLDPQRIAVWGSSAGGHLVSLLGVSGNMPELEGDAGPYREFGSAVTCVVDFFGPVNFLTMNTPPGRIDHEAPDSPESRLLGGPVRERPDAVRDASPLTYVTPDDPPFLIAHGTRDNLVPIGQSEALNAALRGADVRTAPIYIRIDGAGHGFGPLPELDDRVRQFLELHLRDIPTEVSDETIKATARER